MYQANSPRPAKPATAPRIMKILPPPEGCFADAAPPDDAMVVPPSGVSSSQQGRLAIGPQLLASCPTNHKVATKAVRAFFSRSDRPAPKGWPPFSTKSVLVM